MYNCGQLGTFWFKISSLLETLRISSKTSFSTWGVFLHGSVRFLPTLYWCPFLIKKDIRYREDVRSGPSSFTLFSKIFIICSTTFPCVNTYHDAILDGCWLCARPLGVKLEAHLIKQHQENQFTQSNYGAHNIIRGGILVDVARYYSIGADALSQNGFAHIIQLLKSLFKLFNSRTRINMQC